jgi:hypothetical protein
MAAVYNPNGSVQLQILQLIASSARDKLRPQGHTAASRGQGERSVMYVIAVHSISDPDAFWGGKLDLPDGTELPIVVPSSDGKRGVCIFKSDSVDTVRNLVDGATAKVSRNEYFAINERNAQGLPV